MSITDQRYYHPGAGRFMTADPYLASGGVANPPSWNRYAYVEGDPVNHTDKTGLYIDDPDRQGVIGAGIYSPTDFMYLGVVPADGIPQPGTGPVAPFCTAQQFMQGQLCIPIVFDVPLFTSKDSVEKALQDCINSAIQTFNKAHAEWTRTHPKPVLKLPGPFSVGAGVLGSIVSAIAFGGTVGATAGGTAIGTLAGTLGDYFDRVNDWVNEQAPLWDTLRKDKDKCYEHYGPIAYPWAY